MIGQISYLAPDGRPVVGKSSKYSNLVFNFGTISRNLNIHKLNAIYAGNLVLADLELMEA